MVSEKVKLIYLFGVLLSTLFLMSGAFAVCSVDVEDFEILLRAENGDYDESISASDNDEIDVKISFTVESIGDEDDCSDYIKADATIFRYDDDDDEWEEWKSIGVKSQTLEEDDFTFTWTNEFEIDSDYSRYRLDGVVTEDNDELDDGEAYIDVAIEDCSGIELKTYDMTIDEGKTGTKNFYIENNTDVDFEIDFVDVYFTKSILEEGNLEYDDDDIENNDQRKVEVELEVGYVGDDTDYTGTFVVSGYLGDTYCSENDIGREEFTLTVEDTGSDGDDDDDDGPAECEDVELYIKDVTMFENSGKEALFYLKNDGGKKFEITDVQVTDNGVEIENYYNEKYAFAEGGVADIILKINSPSVSEDKVYGNRIEVKGKFVGGKSCSYESVGEKNFDVYVENKNSTQQTTCDGLDLIVPSNIEVNGIGSIPVKIINNTGKKATIYVESELQTSRTLYVLPSNTSIEEDLSFYIEKETSKVVFRPFVSGCNISSKTTSILNTITGKITDLSITSELKPDTNNENANILVKIENPTSKIYKGTLSLELQNSGIKDTVQVQINPGLNTIDLGSYSLKDVEGPRTIRFSSNGEEIYEENNKQPASLTALFGLTGVVGAILISLIIVGLLIFVISNSQETPKEVEEQPTKWEDSKK